MSPRQIDIADMQCWLLRMAQKRWGISAKEVAAIFRDNDIMEYIAELYDLLHLSSYDCALGDIERYLKAKGVTVCAA